MAFGPNSRCCPEAAKLRRPPNLNARAGNLERMLTKPGSGPQVAYLIETEPRAARSGKYRAR
jgi:hypothetical protein